MYFLFNTREEAEACLPKYASDAGVSLRQAASVQIDRAAESFDKHDTDGCVSQWCSNIAADDCRQQAALADQGNLSVFPALVDATTGELVASTVFHFNNKFDPAGGSVAKWAVRRDGSDKVEWVTPYQREANYAKRNLAQVWMLAPATLYARHPGNRTSGSRSTGLAGLASYRGKSVGIDYDAAGLRP